ncbi:phage tail protein [Paenibacillus tyrfis]|uniref:Uncharacterized protein n=1 Tax=Paenibacillus tyrfis TaxID=1501230 RepID=A0A081NYB2_9BACL|nr:phage tail protein [Paenibacillus tyrfis]KEQ23435.1 hypothetical protein ET33_16550 [Paenibacillus tyrfis]
MRTFADDLFTWAHNIFKKQPRKQDMDIFKLANAAGAILNDAKIAMFELRTIKFISSATGRALDLHGIDRKMPRHAGEPDENYRSRLLAAYDLYRLGGTEIGMKSVLASLGYADATLYPLWREKYNLNPNAEYLGKWSQFVIMLDVTNREITAGKRMIFRDSINRAKPIESKLLWLLMFMYVQELIPHSVNAHMKVFMKASYQAAPVYSAAARIRINVRQNVIDDYLMIKYFWKISSKPAPYPFQLDGKMKLGAQALEHGGRHRLGLIVSRSGEIKERSFLV